MKEYGSEPFPAGVGVKYSWRRIIKVGQRRRREQGVFDVLKRSLLARTPGPLRVLFQKCGKGVHSPRKVRDETSEANPTKLRSSLRVVGGQ